MIVSWSNQQNVEEESRGDHKKKSYIKIQEHSIDSMLKQETFKFIDYLFIHKE